MAKCDSPFSAKAQAALAYANKLREEEEEAEAKLNKEMERLALREKAKRDAHKPLVKGQFSDTFLQKINKDFGRLPNGVRVMDPVLPELHVMFEACFYELHQIKRCYPVEAVCAAFCKHTPVQEVPVNRFLLEHYIDIEPDLTAGARCMYMTRAQEQDLLHKGATQDQVNYLKKLFASSKPRSADDARKCGRSVFVQRAYPQPVVVKDGCNGSIASLGCALYDNARVKHSRIMVKWLVKYLLDVLGARPTPDAAIEYY